ncbi:MAG: hypothetical protein JXA06_07465 [Bacteroidetes bacterium]|nr:hypothetical protein [Bacteroidota bacterium]
MPPTIKNCNNDIRFLILSCSGGAGHIRAAEALHKTAQIVDLPIKTDHYDILDFTSPIFKRFYSETYIQMVNRVPELWGFFYQQSERKPYEKKGLLKQFDKLNYKRYLKMLAGLNPDAIICTHFLPYISVSSELKKNNITSPVFAVTTDFDIHQLWIDNVIERYYVFHEESAWQLQSKKVPADKIKITGIPLMPEFRIKESSKTIRKRLGLNKDHFTLLIISGGFGIGRVKKIAEQAASILSTFPNKKFSLLIVCGKNRSAFSEIQAMHFPRNTDVHVYGFVTNVYELMDASDILISKAGGLTSSEALAKSLPMIIIDPIPGQESRNADLIVEHGSGWKAVNLANLGYKLKKILESASSLQKAQAAARSLAKPDAAADILKDIYNFVSCYRR